jgi:uncharacterized membrane protein YbhN (UPF0104 family)
VSGAARPRTDWRRLGGLAAGLAVLAFLAYALVDGWSKVSDYDWQLDPPLFALGLAVLIAFYWTSGIGYGAIIERLHQPAPPGRITLSIWARSLLGRYVPGSVLMVVSRVVLSAEQGVPKRVSLAAIAYEQALSLGVAASGAVAFVALYSDLGHGGELWLLGLVPLVLLALHPRVFGPASSWALRKAKREPIAKLLSGGEVAALVGWYLLIAGLLVIGIWLIVRAAAGPEIGGPGLVGLGFLLAYAVAIVLVIFPSGLGVRDGAFALALAQSEGVSGGVAVTLSVGVRLVLMVVELAFVGAVVVAGRRVPRPEPDG